MSNNGKHKRPFVLTKELEQQESLEGGLSKEFSRSSRGVRHRRRQMAVSGLLNRRRRH